MRIKKSYLVYRASGHLSAASLLHPVQAARLLRKIPNLSEIICKYLSCSCDKKRSLKVTAG